jgi:hypothetical protein
VTALTTQAQNNAPAPSLAGARPSLTNDRLAQPVRQVTVNEGLYNQGLNQATIGSNWQAQTIPYQPAQTFNATTLTGGTSR